LILRGPFERGDARFEVFDPLVVRIEPLEHGRAGADDKSAHGRNHSVGHHL